MSLSHRVDQPDGSRWTMSTSSSSHRLITDTPYTSPRVISRVTHAYELGWINLVSKTVVPKIADLKIWVTTLIRSGRAVAGQPQSDANKWLNSRHTEKLHV
jgi:hypothetical protein